MQIRIPLAAVLLSCAAMAQDGPVEGAKLPRPFAPKPKAFMWPKPVAPQNAAKGATTTSPVDGTVCSVPLLTLSPPTPAPKMPTMRVEPNTAFSMKFVDPPAPPCKDEGDTKRQAPDRRP